MKNSWHVILCNCATKNRKNRVCFPTKTVINLVVAHFRGSPSKFSLRNSVKAALTDCLNWRFSRKKSALFDFWAWKKSKVYLKYFRGVLKFLRARAGAGDKSQNSSGCGRARAPAATARGPAAPCGRGFSNTGIGSSKAKLCRFWETRFENLYAWLIII